MPRTTHLFRCAVACASLCASAASAFTLITPTAGTQPPISHVAVMLEFGGAIPTGTAQVAVDAKSITVPAVGSSSSDTTASGDRVKVSTLDTTHLRIDINIRQVLLNPPSDFCTLKGTGSATLDLQLSSFGGAGAPTGYRLTAWQAVQDEVTNPGSPERPNCGCAARRVKTGAAWSGPAPGANLGRMPMDLVLVLDRSGSMSTTDASGLMRWNSLQTAASSVIDAWKAEGLGANKAGGTNLGADRLGLVYFSTTEMHFTPPGAANIFARRDLAGGWDSIKASIGATGPFASTSIGDGLKYAINTWQADVQNDLTVLVMSDGIQNTAPQVNDGAGTDLGLKVLNIDGTDRRLAYWCAPMLTLALGDVPGSAYDILLDDIAGQTSGHHHFATAGTLPALMVTDLVESLKGNTLSIITQVSGQSVNNNPIPIPAHLDKSVKALVLVLQYVTGTPTTGQGVLVVDAHGPGGTFPKYDQSYFGRHYVVHHIGAPASGDWTFDIRRDAGGVIPYTLTVLADEKSLDFDARFRGHTHPTGAPLNIDTLVSFDGVGVDNLQNSIHVQIQKPDGSFGTLTHDPLPCGAEQKCPSLFACEPSTNTCVLSGGGATDGGDAPDPLEQRIAAQFPDGGLEGSSAGAVTLTSSPGGQYSASFTDTKLAGRYIAHLAIDWTTPQGEHVTRRQTIETQVAVVPDPVASIIAVKAVGPGAWHVIVDPRDKFSNYQGPGFNHRLGVKVADPAVNVAPIADPKVTGSYVAHLTNVTGDPVVLLSWGGVDLKKAPLSKLPQGDGGNGGGCLHCKSSGGFLFFLCGLPLLRRRRRS